jgi:hypothetical protein
MKNTTRALIVTASLVFSAAAIAQSGGASGGAGGSGGSPTQNMDDHTQNRGMAMPGSDANTSSTSKKKMKGSSGVSQSGSNASGSTSPVMQTTPDGKSKTPDATLPAGK